QMLVAEVLGLALFAGFVREHKVSWRVGFGLENRPQRAAISGALVACIFLPFGYGLQRLAMALMMRLHLEPHEQTAVHTLLVTVSWQERLCLGLLAVLVAPMVEELLFRGILYPAIKQTGFPRLAFWGVSVLFAL